MINMYKNCEGYNDPTAGTAESNVIRENKKKESEIKEIEMYEKLCHSFREKARKCGFDFPKDIWLVSKKTHKIHKGS